VPVEPWPNVLARRAFLPALEPTVTSLVTGRGTMVFGYASTIRRFYLSKGTVRRRSATLLEEVRECGVIEQLFRFDDLNLARTRIGNMRWRGAMTPPA
jgi:hypothetical protein